MSLTPHSIAVRGIGYGAQAMAMLGFQEASIALPPTGGGSYPWHFAGPVSTHLSQRQRRPRRTRDADLVLLTIL
jgi:hypothetical protein